MCIVGQRINLMKQPKVRSYDATHMVKETNMSLAKGHYCDGTLTTITCTELGIFVKIEALKYLAERNNLL